MVNLFKAKDHLCKIGKKLYDKGLTTATDGNLSLKIAENRLLCTPTSLCKGELTRDDLVMVDLEGNKIAGRREPSSELRLHLAIYKQNKRIQSVLHCHPPNGLAFAATQRPIPNGVLSEVELFLGEIPTIPYAPPGSLEFANSIISYVDKAKVAVLANHGTVSWDTSLEKACATTEMLESYCKVLISSGQLGEVASLTSQQIRELIQIKKRWNLTDFREDLPLDVELSTIQYPRVNSTPNRKNR
ncbi:MAG: class II aldolase/adducin family protein [Pirellulaceae bacterium]|nr:class II aldolase/adducin family protein [Pirellulaceae bacterium]